MKILRLLWRLFVFIRYLCLSFYFHWIVMPLGILYCLMRLRDKNTTYIVICDHIGDTLFTLGYLRSYRAKNQATHVTVVTTFSLSDIVALYPHDVEQCMAIPRYFLRAILKGSGMPLGMLLYRHLRNITIIEPANHLSGTFEFIRNFPDIQLIDCIRYGILELPQDCDYVLPYEQMPHVLHSVKPVGKTVVLSPCAQVTEEISDELFRCLAEKLIENGYTVLTNIGSDREKEIKGTGRFECSLTDTFTRAGTDIRCFIGLRSGLLDLVQHAGCGVIALYPQDSGMEHFFSLGQGVLPREMAYQYRTTDNIDADVQQIFHYFEQIVRRQ